MKMFSGRGAGLSRYYNQRAKRARKKAASG